ncbi:MAG TPA: hypothetical protein VMU72_00305 [Gaiellaceae bacterium]|nr:hypothetical protein [Gaiellaceae bacterium]
MPVSPVTKHAIARSGNDRKVLNNLVRNPGLVDSQRLSAVRTASPASASTLGSAFDLGSGPTLLLVLLAGSVLVLLGTGGVRAWRNRHRV